MKADGVTSWDSGIVVAGLSGLDGLIASLQARGYCVAGPMVREGAVVVGELVSSRDLPLGWTDRQEGGVYRLEKTGRLEVFSHSVPAQGWKRFLFPAEAVLWRAERKSAGAGSFGVAEGCGSGVAEEEQPVALFGIRGCDLSAVGMLDGALGCGAHGARDYVARRRGVFVVALQCGYAGGTCFCASMGTGPRVRGGFDLALTELPGGAGEEAKYFVEVGSERGAELVSGLDAVVAGAAERERAEGIVEETGRHMGRVLETEGLRDVLLENLEHPRWEVVAQRCLTCANCTMACPTCFCHTVEDWTNLGGTVAERRRRWDSCFTSDFSYLSGGSVRSSGMSRYRQWMTHKLATWVDQFGTFGCVGCGRCITWCPVGIDLTEEARVIRETRRGGAAGAGGAAGVVGGGAVSADGRAAGGGN